MIVGKAIYNILSNASDLTDIVGSRIFPVAAGQQTAFPFVVFDVERTDPVNRMQGRALMHQISLTVTSYSKRYDEAANVAVEVCNALDRVTPGTYNGVAIQGIIFESQSDGLQDEDDVYFIPMGFKVNLTTPV